MRTINPLLAMFMAIAMVGCTNLDEEFATHDGGSNVTPDQFPTVDGAEACTDPSGDYDGDGITNAQEGCLTGRDSDGDKIPDWQDFDADGDKIPDSLEKGAKDSTGKCVGSKNGKYPCDTDGDGVPDYLDKDSDGDGLQDGDEDNNYDGELGCCVKTCGQMASAWQKENCTLNAAGCGDGQTCVNKACTPSAAFKCSEGETAPLKKDTFGDGKLDNERGTFICRDATEDKPQGRKPVQLRKDTVNGDWHIAIEKFAKYGAITVAGASKTNKLAAASINYDKTTDEVAGFVLSKATSNSSIQAEMTALIALLNSAGLGTLTVRASGIQGKSHDRYDQVEGTIVDIDTTSTDVSSARNQVVAALLGKQLSDLTNVSSPFGSSHSSLMLRFTTMRRFAFKKDSSNKVMTDSNGYPIDDNDSTKWRIVIMGAVASKTNYQNPKLQTGFLVDDLSNGTTVAIANDRVVNECDVGTIIQLPIADIIWVIDESGSMSTERQDVVNNANNFFSRALASGLDFRMGVTNVVHPPNAKCIGKFCSQISSNTSDDGGTDRFLLPTEQNIFSACINNPPCYEGGSEYGLVNAYDAVKKHLPRATGDQSKIRKNATLVIIVATDEIPESLSGAVGGYSNFSKCTLPASNLASVLSGIQKYLDMFTGVTDPEAVAMFHVIGGECNNKCNADVAHGYRELAQKLGGQTASVCQKNLGNTLQVIIDTITGKASPVVLDYVPISSSLAVAMDAVEINRSRTNGFDYRTNANSLVFINVKYKKGSEVIASYKRWKRQEDIK